MYDDHDQKIQDRFRRNWYGETVDDQIARHFEKQDTGDDLGNPGLSAHFLAVLDSIGTENELELDEARPQKPPIFYASPRSDPRNDPDVILPEPKPYAAQTPYDRAFTDCRALERELAELSAFDELTKDQEKRLAALPDLVTRARERMAVELKRAADPTWQGRTSISTWRKTPAGKAARRTTRPVPNLSLAEYSDDEKKAREDEQKYISNTRIRLAKQKLSDTEIEAKIEAGLEKRRQKELRAA